MTASGYGFGSAEALYRHLNQEPRYPVCPVCGCIEAEPDHCKPPRQRQPAKGSGDAVELPSASRAIPALKAALAKAATVDLQHLERRRERLVNERFTVHQEWVLGYEVPQERTTLARVYTDHEGNERWELEDAVVAPGEASPVPPEPLTRLVSAGVLLGASVDELVEALHPDVEGVDRDRLAQAVKDLQEEAGKLSTLIRGGRIRRGPHTEALDAVEQAVAQYGRRRRREGASLDDVFAELRDGALWRLPEGLNPDRLKRLVESNESWRMTD